MPASNSPCPEADALVEEIDLALLLNEGEREQVASLVYEAFSPPRPVPMVLHCPECRARHIDVGEFATKVHHTHACQSCGFVWRPAVVPTLGVQFLPGFKNEDEPEEDDACEDTRGTCEQCGSPADGPGDAERVQCDCSTTVCSACCIAVDGESYCPTCAYEMTGAKLLRARARIAELESQLADAARRP